MFRKLCARWRLAGILESAERNGQSVITVPFELVAAVKLDIWRRQVSMAQAKWAKQVAEVSLEDWRAAMRERTDEPGE